MEKTPEQLLEELSELAKPLIKWLNENKNPNHIILIKNTSVELFNGTMADYTIKEYILD